MEVLYHGIKTRYVYDFPFCLPHELLMSLRSYNLKGQCHDSRMRQFHVFTQLHASYTQAMRQSHCQNNLWKTYANVWKNNVWKIQYANARILAAQNASLQIAIVAARVKRGIQNVLPNVAVEQDRNHV